MHKPAQIRQRSTSFSPKSWSPKHHGHVPSAITLSAPDAASMSSDSDGSNSNQTTPSFTPQPNPHHLSPVAADILPPIPRTPIINTDDEDEDDDGTITRADGTVFAPLSPVMQPSLLCYIPRSAPIEPWFARSIDTILIVFWMLCWIIVSICIESARVPADGSELSQLVISRNVLLSCFIMIVSTIIGIITIKNTFSLRKLIMGYYTHQQ